MKNKKEYFETPEEIIDAIEKGKQQAAEALEKSEAEARIAKTCFQQGPAYAYLGERHKLESKKWGRKYVLLTERTIPALSQKLAEIKTPMMFAGMDPSIPRRIRKPSKK